MVKIQLFGETASIEGYQWFCDSAPLEDMLNAQLNPLGPSGADPDPDLAAAKAAIDRFGGKILQADAAPYVEGTVY